METYNDVYTKIRPIEMKVLSGSASKEEIKIYRDFLDSDLHKEQIEKDRNSMISTVGVGFSSYSVFISG